MENIYKKMYYHLLNAVSKAIEDLMLAEQNCEEMFMSADDAEIDPVE